MLHNSFKRTGASKLLNFLDRVLVLVERLFSACFELVLRSGATALRECLSLGGSVLRLCHEEVFNRSVMVDVTKQLAQLVHVLRVVFELALADGGHFRVGVVGLIKSDHGLFGQAALFLLNGQDILLYKKSKNYLSSAELGLESFVMGIELLAFLAQVVNSLPKSVVFSGELVVLDRRLVKPIFEALDRVRRLLLLDMRVVDAADLLALLRRLRFDAFQLIFDCSDSEIRK